MGRDYLYIDDFISACMAYIQFTRQLRQFQAFNVSSGLSLSINQIRETIEDVTKQRLKKVSLAGRAY